MRVLERSLERRLERSIHANSGVVFNTSLVNLSDVHGNVPESSIRNSTATAFDYLGVLKTIPINSHRLNYGRWDGTNWFDDTGGQARNDALDLSNDGGMLITGNSIKKISGGTAWNAAVSSNNNFTGSAYCEATLHADGRDLMLGLNNDPKTDTSFGTINYAVFIQGKALKVYESGVLIGAFGTVKSGDKISALYEGTTIHYQLNGKDIYTTTVAAGLILALDTSFFSVGGQLDNIIFNAKKINEPLHPSHTFKGTKRYRSFMPYATAQVVASGGHRFEAGRYYQTLTGGTTNGATLLADIGITDWIDKGIYNAGFGVLVEGGSTNAISATNYRTPLMWFSGGTTFTQTRVGVDGTANKAITVTGTAPSNYALISVAVANDTATHFISIAIEKNQGIVSIRLPIVGGSPIVNSTCVIDTDTGIITSGAGSLQSVMGYYIFNAPVTNNGMGNTLLRLDVLAQNTSVTVDYPCIELNSPIASSLMAGGASRANEMGNIKWNSSFFPQAAGTLGLTIKPQFASGDLAAAQRSIVNLNTNLFGLLYQHISGIQVFATYEGTNASVQTASAWIHTDSLELFIRWGIGADSANPAQQRLVLTTRNANRGESFVSVSVAYDGNFTDTGFYQLLKNLGGNNTAFLNNAIWNKPLTDADINALVEL